MFDVSSLSVTHIISVSGTAAFAISAVFAASNKEVDLFALMVLGVITAVGGGTLRDTLLQVPVFWSQDMSFIWISLAATTAAFMLYGLLKLAWLNRIYLYVDSIAIALFAIQGTNKAWELGFGLPLAPVMLGVITAVGGGVIRDMLIQRPTLLFSKELYAIPVALGCALHALVLHWLPQYADSSSLAGIALIVYGRHLSINRKLMVPQWALLGYRFTLIK
ncbi:trimeric intracellular cation channel family protein [Ferrimonas balearica]|uniref:trimeric intracellular cation channel family protein n=1 Tax=Ferrimonas balearica TaxID=44012 RepID=UPI001F35F292|nr:trimeric intracellular cation channel family protein [Ferrimonas balearica]MBY6016189.1 trimeric intracellular cation channel family protein [Halomonas denitrificans]MBY6095542.1 trimeric intracellular cation channel family protein [Ferrimonas balearica]